MRVVSFTVSPETAKVLSLADTYSICRGLIQDFSWTCIRGFRKEFKADSKGEYVEVLVLLVGSEDINVA